MPTTSDSKPRRHWTAADKAKLGRRHFRDGIPLAMLADENGTTPSMIHAWIRSVLGGADQVLADKRERDDQRTAKQLEVKDDRIRHFEEVTAELSMEVLQLKMRAGRSDRPSGIAPGERRGGGGRAAVARAGRPSGEGCAGCAGPATLDVLRLVAHRRLGTATRGGDTEVAPHHARRGGCSDRLRLRAPGGGLQAPSLHDR